MTYHLRPLWILMNQRPLYVAIWTFVIAAVMLFPVMAWMGGP